MSLDLIHHTAIRWADPDPKYVPLLKDGGITAVVATPDESFDKACSGSGIQVIAGTGLQSVVPAEAEKARPGGATVVKAGLWPGIQRPDPQTASATRSLWMDQNCSLVNYLSAVYPTIPPVLGYLPDQEAGVSPNQLVAFDALELALVDAWVPGGNYLMALHPRFRQALTSGAPDALAAWRKLGRTAKWLRTNETLFRQPPLPIITLLVDRGEVVQEVANLCYRHNVSPALAIATNPPAPDPLRREVLVAVSIEPPKGEARKRILAHAAAGTTLIVDGHGPDAWWRDPALKPVRSDSDRDYYALGKGRVAAYKGDIGDPGMFALDVIDVITQKRRPARIWNCNAGLVIASQSPGGGAAPGGAVLKVVNYGRAVEFPILARIQGRFQQATLLRPEGEPQEVKVSPRGGASEVTIDSLDRVAAVVFR